MKSAVLVRDESADPFSGQEESTGAVRQELKVFLDEADGRSI